MLTALIMALAISSAPEPAIKQCSINNAPAEDCLALVHRENGITALAVQFLTFDGKMIVAGHTVDNSKFQVEALSVGDGPTVPASGYCQAFTDYVRCSYTFRGASQVYDLTIR
jgi:hypothetical protein